MAALTYSTRQNLSQTTSKDLYPWPDPECYIYLHHTETMIILPSYAEANNDSIQIKYNSSTPLMRSAPIQSYANSGPRSLQVHFDLHRDMIYELNGSPNKEVSTYNQNTKKNENYDDYVDLMAKQIQAAALPVYQVSSKMVNPPLVSLKLGNDIFIKGVVSGSVGVSYGLPVLANGKYAQVAIDFQLVEVMPYDATQVQKYGSYRGIDTSLTSTNTYVAGSFTPDVNKLQLV